ncbi:hypothetical protein Trydic_g10513 [Trypoxylus dichotomus]
MSNECTDPIDLFRTEAYHDDIQVQLRAVKKLPTLAVALDVDRTRHELIPTLENFLDIIYFNNDEVLMVLSEQLGKFVPFIGGVEYAFLLLPMLEKLAATDDTCTREKAVESLQHIASLMNGPQLEEHFIRVIQEMSKAEWYTSKCSAAGLIAICYPKLSDQGKLDMRQLFLSLLENDSPMVKREAAKYFSDLIKIVEVSYLKEEFVPSFRKLSKDDQDSVRLLSVNVAVALASRLSPPEIEEHILDTLHCLCVDFSWRVRYQFANEINSVQTAVGPSITRKSIVPLYKILVRDSEANIREISARNIVQFCEILQKSYLEDTSERKEDLDPIIKEEILPLIKELDKDVVEDVQDGLYSVIISLSSLLGEVNTKDFLVPLITSSIENDSSKVKESIVTNLNNIICVVGIEDLSETVQKLMTDLVKTTIWRTRRNLIVTLSHIARHSKKEYFDQHLKSLYISLLNDPVYAVRKVAPLILPILVKYFGMKWAKNDMIQTYLEFSEKTYYLLRMMCLFGIDELMSPTLEKRNHGYTYLDLLKDKEDANSSKIINRIKNLNEVLTIQLQEEWVGIVLAFIEDEDYFNDDIRAYSEEALDAFAKCGELVIGSITEGEIKKRDTEETYIEGLLFLILAFFLDKIHILAQDLVFNVRMRAANTLQKICNFNAALIKELEEPWVEKLINVTSLNDRVDLMQECRTELLDAVNQKDKMANINPEILQTSLALDKIAQDADIPSPMEVDPPPELQLTAKAEDNLAQLTQSEETVLPTEIVEKLEVSPAESTVASETLVRGDEGLELVKTEPASPVVEQQEQGTSESSGSELRYRREL